MDPEFGYDFLYWLKSAFGATRCGRRWRAVLTRQYCTHHRASGPILNDLHAGVRHQGRRASLRDDLRPPWTPDTTEQAGWLSGRWQHSVCPVSRTPCAPPTLCGKQQSHRMHRGRPPRTSRRGLRHEKVRGSNPLSSTRSIRPLASRNASNRPLARCVSRPAECSWGAVRLDALGFAGVRSRLARPNIRSVRGGVLAPGDFCPRRQPHRPDQRSPWRGGAEANG